MDTTAPAPAASAPPAGNKSAGVPATAASKKHRSPEEMKAALRAAEERCVGLQERARLLVRPDVFRKVDELQGLNSIGKMIGFHPKRLEFSSQNNSHHFLN